VFVVEDVLTTGGSAREVIEVLKSFEVRPLGVGAILNRSAGNPFERDDARPRRVDAFAPS
jgi:orotate phosphoribosyltransferase